MPRNTRPDESESEEGMTPSSDAEELEHNKSQHLKK